MRRIVCWLLIAMFAITSEVGCAESAFDLGLLEKTWSAELKLSARTVMPLDKTRTEELNRLIGHISLSLDWAPSNANSAFRAGLCLSVDGTPIASLLEHRQNGQTSVCIDGDKRIFVSSADPLAALLGEQETLKDADIAEHALSILPEADIWVQALASDPSKFQVKKISTSIKGYGKATASLQWVQPKSDVVAFDQYVRDCCPHGFLETILAKGSFTGKQSLTLLTDKEGTVLRVNYAGGFQYDEEDEPREVTLRWRRKRLDGDIADSMTLKTPSASAANRDNLTLTRTEKENKGATKLQVEFNYDHKAGKDRVRTYGTAKLTHNGRITGSVQIKQDRSGADEGHSAWTLTPDISVNPDTSLPSGSARWVYTENGHRQSDWTAQFSLNPLDRSLEEWPPSGDTIELDGLPEDERDEIWQELIRTVTPRLIRALVRLPAEDTLYISRDLPGWDEIKSAVEADTEEQEAENR